MKNSFLLFLAFLLIGCSSSKGVYWCGDHPCIDKNEKEAYFKKTMIVEVRSLEKYNKKEKTEIEQITKQARLKEKERKKKRIFLEKV